MEKYTVQSGDTLWGISRHFGVSVKNLADINGLCSYAQQHIIYPGQVLILPFNNKKYDTRLKLAIFDLVWRPLKNVNLKLTYDGKEHHFTTNDNGSVLCLLIEDSTKGIKVELQHLNKKEYIVIAHHKKLPLGNKYIRISSREMVIKGETRIKEGAQRTTKAKEKKKASDKTKNDNKDTSTNPDINKTIRVDKGLPAGVSNIGNLSEGLRLSPDAEQFRKYIVESAEKYDFLPEGLSALIYAESRWKNDATNSTGSGAKGLGQFKPDTWLSVCALPESKVYKKILKDYSCQSVYYKNDNLHGIMADNKEIKINRHAILALRVNGEYSIDMIGLLDRQGINNLSLVLPEIKTLNKDELIKLAYLVHHNGQSGAYDIIMNGNVTAKGYRKYSDSALYDRLYGNINKDEADRYMGIDGNARTAYVAWIINYYNSIIVPDDFRVSPTNTKYDMKDILKKLNPYFDSNTELPAKDKNNLPSKDKGTMDTNTTEQKPPSDTGSIKKWHNPLDICKIRCHGLGASGVNGMSFGMVRLNDDGTPKAHQGDDLEAEPGTLIYAVADCHVVFHKDAGDYGLQLCILVHVDDLPPEKKNLCKYNGAKLDEIYFFYAHLSGLNIGPKNHPDWPKVKCGEVLGKTGCSGNAIKMTKTSKGSHLHFEVRKIWNTGKGLDNHLNPAPFIDGFNHK